MITDSSYPYPAFTLTRVSPGSFVRSGRLMYRAPRHVNGILDREDPYGGYTQFLIPADPAGVGASLLPFPRPTATNLLIVSGLAVGKNDPGSNPHTFAFPRKPFEGTGAGGAKIQTFDNRVRSYRIAIIAEDPEHPIDTLQLIGDPMRRTFSYRWAGNSQFAPTHLYDVTDPSGTSEAAFLAPFHAQRQRRRSDQDFRFRLYAGYDTESSLTSKTGDKFGTSGRPMLHGRRTYASLSPDCTPTPPSLVAPDAHALRDPFNPGRPPVDFTTPAAGFGFADLRISREVPAVFLIDIPLARPDQMTRHVSPADPSFPVPHRRADDASFLCAPGAAPFSLTPHDARHRPLFLADPLPLICTGDPVIDLHVLFHAIPGLALTYLTACAEVALLARAAAAEGLLQAGGAPSLDNPSLPPAVPAELHTPLARILRQITRTGGGTLPDGLPRDTPADVLALLTTGPSAPRPLPLAVTTDTFLAGERGCLPSREAAQRASGVSPGSPDAVALWQARPLPLTSVLDAMAGPLTHHIAGQDWSLKPWEQA